MSRNDYLRRLLSPDGGRWQPMLMGLALFAAGAGAAVLFQESWLISAAMVFLAIGAWVVGACAMVGYVRWFFAGELQQARRDGINRDGEGKK